MKYFLIIFILINIFSYSYSKENNNFYRIKVQVNTKQRILSGVAEIDIYNNSSVSLNSLYFFLGLNNNYGTKMTIKEVRDLNNNKLEGNFYNYEYLDNIIEDQTIYKVNLNKSLESDKFLKLFIEYEINNFSKINDIFFFDDSIYDEYSSSWYPRLINFRDNYWKKKDFVSNNYEVEISVDATEYIVSSGFEFENNLIKETQKKKYLYRINNSRNFSFIISSNIVPENKILQSKVKLTTYYKSNKGNRWGNKIHDVAEEIINFYHKTFGFYPYNQLNIVPGYLNIQGGYSNSNIIVLHDYINNFVSEKDLEKYLSFYLSYLIAHQYTSFFLNEVSDNPKWISFGLSLYMSSLYLKEKKIKDDYLKEITNYYIDASKSGFNTKVIRTYEELKYGFFDWHNVIEKAKSFEIFKLLENIIGRKLFIQIISDFFKDYRKKIIDTNTFTNFVQFRYNKDLSYFFNSWLYTSDYIDYGITKAIQEKRNNKYRLKVYIKKFGKIDSQIPVLLTLKSGAKSFNFYDGKQKEAELIFEYNEPVLFVEIDYFNNVPDINKSNNKMGI